jgi:hypothetical protein
MISIRMIGWTQRRYILFVRLSWSSFVQEAIQTIANDIQANSTITCLK